MAEEELNTSEFLDASEFTGDESQEDDEFLNKGFSQKQIGSLAKYIEPVNGNSSLDTVLDTFREDPSIKALPVEEYDRVIGVIDRKTVEDATKNAFRRFMAKPVIEYTTRVSAILSVKDYIEKAIEKVSRINKEYGIVYFPVFNRRNFYGLVSLDEFLTRMAEIREQDLQKASSIQTYQFPSKKELSKFKYSITAWNRMANSLGGDCYYAFQMSEYESMVCCFDVSGKNVAASLLTMACSSFFKFLGHDKNRPNDPVKIVSMLDAYLEDVVPVGNFITGVIVYVDIKRHIFNVFNCGHTTTFLVYKNPDSTDKPKVASIDPKLPPFGMGAVKKELDESARNGDAKNKPYMVLSARRGIHLELYSDGFTDMQNEDGFRFEDQNARNFFINLYSKPVDEISGLIEYAVDNYIGNAMLPDDITVIDIRFDSILFL